jgi:hypothetical protein
LLVKVSRALTPPATCGLNVTVKDALWPAWIVVGNESPPTLNTELFELTAVTVTAAPVAFKLPEDVPLSPTTTLPRFIVVGLTVSCPVAVVPVPDNGIVRVGFDALETTLTLPLALAADAGVNVTVKVLLCPAVRVRGVVIPLKLNPVPEMLA